MFFKVTVILLAITDMLVIRYLGTIFELSHCPSSRWFIGLSVHTVLLHNFVLNFYLGMSTAVKPQGFSHTKHKNTNKKTINMDNTNI